MVARREPSRQLVPAGNRNALKNGNPINRAGRAPGTKNKVPYALKEAIVMTAKLLGEDNKGKDGLIGYLKKVEKKDYRQFVMLLKAVLPLTVSARIDIDESITYRSSQEVREELQRRGVPIDGVFSVIQGGKSDPPHPDLIRR